MNGYRLRYWLILFRLTVRDAWGRLRGRRRTGVLRSFEAAFRAYRPVKYEKRRDGESMGYYAPSPTIRYKENT